MKKRAIITAAAILSLILISVLALASPASAYEGRGGDTVIIKADEVIENDLYIGAQNIIVDGVIKGDLLAAGTTIRINGVVEGDLQGAGQSILINGKVGEAVRVAASVVTVAETARIKGDLIGFGYSLEVKPGAEIGRDLLFYGGQVLLDGQVAGNVEINAGSFDLKGSVGGNVNTEVGAPEDQPPFSPLAFIPNMPPVPQVPPGFTLEPSAAVGGRLCYTYPKEIQAPQGVVKGEVTHFAPKVEAQPGSQQPPQPPPNPALEWFWGLLRSLIGLLLVGLLMAWLVPALTRQSADLLQARPLPSLGWGLVSVFAVITAAILLVVAIVILAVVFNLATLSDLAWRVISIGGVSFSALLVGFGLAVSYISKVVVGYQGGRWILSKLKPDIAGGRVWPMILGVVIFALLASIPYLGFLVTLVVVLFGLGALWMLGSDKLMEKAPTAAGG